MDRMRVVRYNMIPRRQAETESTTEEKEAENDPIVRARVWIMAFGVRVVEDGKTYHP